MEPEAVYTQSEDGTCAVAWVDDLAKVGPRAVKWLWPGRVPLGKLTLLVGDPGRGKSLLALDMAARVSRGAPWPDACGTCGTGAPACARTAEGGCATPRATAEGGCATPCAPLGRTVLLSAEDDTADTIRPRLDALGGDPSRVSVIRAVNWEDIDRNEPLSLARDVKLLEAVVRTRPDTRLIVLDPISAYLGGGESYNNADIRRLLAPVKAMAEELNVAVLAITHLTKRRAASVLYRAMGSMAYVAASRAAWAVVPDREAPGRMLLVPIKCNLVGGATGLAYRIVPHPDNPALPIVAWEPEPVAMTADEAMEALPKPTPREEAAEWLRQVLSAGPLPSNQVERQGSEAGFTLRTLRRAKADLGILPYREGTGWMVRLPDSPGRVPAAPDEVSVGQP